MTFTARIPVDDYNGNLYLDQVDEGVKLTVSLDAGDQLSAVLDDTNVRNLRLALQRYERAKS